MRGVAVLIFSSVCAIIFASADEFEAGALAESAEAKLFDDSGVEAPMRSLRSVGVTKSTGGQSFMNSLGGMVIGWLLLPFSFALLMVNEQNAARMGSLIGRAKSSVQETSSKELDHQLDWQLISTSGETETSSKIEDPDFVNNSTVKPKPLVDNSVKLNRKLEIYQNVQKSKTEGEGSNERTTYWVEQEWCSTFVDSDGFQPENRGQSNPPLPGFAKDDGFDKTWYADPVNMGAYLLPKTLLESVDNWEGMGDWCYPEERNDAPRVGDLRVKWSKCPCGPTSIVALQDDVGSFKPYRIISRLCMCSKDAEIEALRNAANLSDENYEKSLACPIPCICCLCDLASKFLHTFSKAEVYYIKAGVMQGAAESMSEIEGRAGFTAWCCRFTGWILMFMSIMMIANPMVKAIQFIPFIGPFFASLLHTAIFLVAFVMTLLLSAVVIGIAYILVRPLLTISLAGIVCAVFVVGSKLLPNPDNPDSVTDVVTKLKLL